MNAKKIYVLLIFTILIVIGLITLRPMIYQYYNKKHIDKEMADKSQEIYSANIGVIAVTQHDGINGYSSGASGVIFEKRDSRYYALTAYHVVKNKSEYLIQTTNSETLSEYRENHPNREKSSLNEYYNTKIKAKLEFSYEESDLAIISFESDENLDVISVSDVVPKKNAKIMVVSNLEGVFFHNTYGRIKSNHLITFATDDGQCENKVLKHSAYVAPGSSGGAVINQKMNLVGINIGGGVDLFGHAKYGVFIPCDQIRTTVAKWKKGIID